MTAPNPLYQEGYSMTDTTGQQAVTVAQEDREAAANMHAYIMRELGDAAPAKHLCDIMTERMRTGWHDNSEGVQAFARHRPASVSSASADLPAGMKAWAGGDGAPDDWDGGSVLRADGQTEHSDDITIQQWKHPVPRCKWNVVAYTPSRVLELPEPVPAANQAGEVAKIARDHVEAFIVQSRLGGLMDGDETLLTSLLRQAMFTALATQPATSQPEETWMNDPLSLDSGLPATSQEGEAIDFAEVDAVIQEMIDVAVNDGEDGTPETDFDRGDVDRWQAKLQQATGHKNGFPSRALAATPTPPTLSEDLDVDAIVKKSLSIATLGTPGQIAVQIATNAVRTTLAVLAQVKAS